MASYVSRLVDSRAPDLQVPNQEHGASEYGGSTGIRVTPQSLVTLVERNIFGEISKTVPK